MASTTDPRSALGDCDTLMLDMDGTLLPENGCLPASDIDRLNRLIDQGLNFTIATARNYDSVRPILAGLNFKLPVILFNGVYLTDFHRQSRV